MGEHIYCKNCLGKTGVAGYDARLRVCDTCKQVSGKSDLYTEKQMQKQKAFRERHPCSGV